MTLTPWMHENAFIAGTIVRADAMNVKLDGIAQAIQAICNQINQKIPNLPATFTGETQIPEKTLPNTLLVINSAGAMDLYPKAQFDADVANAATAAAQAATSATTAQTLTNQAQIHEQNAEEHAEAAAASAESAEQAKDDTMSALNTRLGTTGNLGTAAQRNVMTSPTDTATPSALMPLGAFGWGQQTDTFTGNLNDAPFGFCIAGAGAANNYFGQNSFCLTIDGSPVSTRKRQMLFSFGGTNRVERFFDGTTWSNWSIVYTSANVVGPVSQSGGIPTGALLQWGVTPTGLFFRFFGGLQICFHRINSVPYSTSDNGAHYSSNQSWTYPAVFIETPRVAYTVSGLTTTTGTACWPTSVARLTIAPPGVSADSAFYVLFSQAGGYTASVDCLAIGRWHS